jgi:voltage-gated potassium channel
LFVVCGSFVIGAIENWSAVEALYFGFTTATTIGYGDVVPKDYNGKWLCVFYIPMSVVLMARFFGDVADIFVQTEMEASTSPQTLLLIHESEYSQLLFANSGQDYDGPKV